MRACVWESVDISCCDSLGWICECKWIVKSCYAHKLLILNSSVSTDVSIGFLGGFEFAWQSKALRKGAGASRIQISIPCTSGWFERLVQHSVVPVSSALKQ